jgi:hypothetical protein
VRHERDRTQRCTPEALKLKGTLALWMCLIAPGVVVALYVLQISSGPAGVLVTPAPARPGDVRPVRVRLWAFLMLPLFITLESALLAGLEHGERQVEAPARPAAAARAHYLAKLLALAALVALGFLALVLLIPLGGLLLPGCSRLRHRRRAALAYLLASRPGLPAPAAGGRHLPCWIAVRWSSFTVAVSVGMSATVMASSSASPSASATGIPGRCRCRCWPARASGPDSSGGGQLAAASWSPARPARLPPPRVRMSCIPGHRIRRLRAQSCAEPAQDPRHGR